MDPSAFMGNPAQFNPSQFASAQQQQQHQQQQQQLVAMQNGQLRNASPSFQNPAYQTNPVVPSKRPRPREDSLAGSPRQNPGMLPTSRSDTPQQFPGYQSGGMPQQHQQQNPGQPQPSPYNHLQPNGSANATPSPIMGSNMRPGSVPQRVATASPHPFSPSTQQQFGPQASPVPSEHSSTPQPNPYLQNMQNMPPGFNQNFTPTPSPARPSPNPTAMTGMMQQQQHQQQQQQQQQMGGQMPQQMGQIPNQMFPPNLQGRNPMEQQKMAAYQARLQQQLQAQGNMQNMHPGMQQNIQMAAQIQAQNLSQGRGMVPKQQMQPMPNGQMPQGGTRPQSRQPMGQDQFMKSLSKFMHSKGLPLETNVVIGNRPVNLMHLFQAVQSKGGYKSTTASNQWPHVSNAIGFHPVQIPQAPSMLKDMYERNILRFEEFWTAQQNQQRMMQQQQGRQTQPAPSGQPQPSPAKQMSPQAQVSQGMMQAGQPQAPQAPQQPVAQHQQQQHQQPNPQSQHQQQHAQQHQQQPQVSQSPLPQQQQPQQHTPQLQQQPQQPKPPHISSMQGQAQLKQPPFVGPQGTNGSTAHQGQAQLGLATSTPGQHRNSLPRGVEPVVSAGQLNAPGPFPAATHAHAEQIPSLPTQSDALAGPSRSSGKTNLPKLVRLAAASDAYPCDVRLPQPDAFGGFKLAQVDIKGMMIEQFKPDVPGVWELGMVDLQALTRSIESGIHGEVRMALDTLATVTQTPPKDSKDPLFIQLKSCEELVEALVECAEEQLEQLAENTVEVSDDIQLAAYEDIARACWVDRLSVRKLPEFATPEYELDRAVDRLTCIFTILRNLSFEPEAEPTRTSPQLPFGPHHNHQVLADESVIKLVCDMIRYLGTRNMLLRTHANTLEFMKDAITLLSNIAGAVEIPGREQALCLLHFLLAFAPGPGPSIRDDRLYFPPFEPALQPYLFHAVDALAKFLARDEPNRTFYKTIFALDAGSTTPYELLTKTFALAISVVPIQLSEGQLNRAVMSPKLRISIENRAPLLMQGLLAAGILASLAPSYESGVARAWLSNGDGFAEALYFLVQVLSHQYEQSSAGRDQDFPYIVALSVSLLRKLGERAFDPTDPSALPANALPSAESVFGIMSMKSSEWARDGIIRDLTAYADLHR